MPGCKMLAADDLRLINEALGKGYDVRIHPEKNGLKITSEHIRVLKKTEPPKYGFSDKRNSDYTEA